jgi:hypothetical protein
MGGIRAAVAARQQSIYLGPNGVQTVADFNRDGKADLLNGLSILLQR